MANLFEDAVSPDVDAGGVMSTIRAVLESKSYVYREWGENRLALSICSVHGDYAVVFITNDESDILCLCGIYDVIVPDDTRVAVAEVLSRINSRIWLGSFEVDFADGALRFRFSLDVENKLLSAERLHRMLKRTLDTMDRFHVAVFRVAFESVEPAAAIEGL